ncbi:MAG: glycosyltransferase [Acaryochloridaceae cyanobacterium SU_2_1]|nr:glycosyltransferase [Acaryochloridaceae cyanobacterium SU_2_1]
MVDRLPAKASQTQGICLLLFVKSPIPGQVKTRLARSIGLMAATALYQCFTQDILLITQTLSVDQLIFYAPATDSKGVEAWLGPQYVYHPQQGQDLGARMAHAFTHCFELGYSGVLIIGSDSPDLPAAYLEEGLRALSDQQVVVGASEDGGYYTLGFTAENFTPQVFEGIAWSTSRVYQQTLHELKEQQRSIHALPPWYDVDTLTDLRQLYQRLRKAGTLSASLLYLQHHEHQLFGSPPPASYLLLFQSCMRQIIFSKPLTILNRLLRELFMK